MAAQRATAARPRSMPGACAPSSFMRAMLPRCSASSRAIPSTSSTPPGQGPAEDEALQEPHDVPPPDTAFGRQWLLGFVDETGELVAMANCECSVARLARCWREHADGDHAPLDGPPSTDSGHLLLGRDVGAAALLAAAAHPHEQPRMASPGP
jgi:hypothetical protein